MLRNNLLNKYSPSLSTPVATPANGIKLHQPAATIAKGICYFGVIHVLIGLFFYYASFPTFLSYVDEDGYIEYLTAFFLLMTSFYCLFKGLISSRKVLASFFCLMAVLFFFGFGEEISWGQRIFGFDTPTDLKKINSQQEFNVHNTMVGEVKLNKLIFGKIMYLSLFTYFLGFNFFYERQSWFRQLIDKTGIPLPAPVYSLLFVSSFLAVMLIQHGEKWELDEFAIAVFVFLCFFQPYNKTLQQKLSIKAGKVPLEVRRA